MGTFVRAIITGFGFSMGSAIYKRVSGKLGLEEADKAEGKPESVTDSDGDGDDCDAES